MSKNIFLTGGTGFIGGTVLDTLVKQHPEYKITVLLRKTPAGFAERYPDVQVINGSLSDLEKIEEVSRSQNLVILCGKSGKDIKALNAHIAGLMCRDETSFIIRLGGTSIIADFWDDFSHGDLNPKVWSDIDDIDEITSLPANYPHRPVDIALHEAAEKYDGKLKVAVICPPGIYGQGRGMGNTQSLYVPALYEEAVRRGATFYCSTGGNLRGWVHIEDLMKVYLALVESAMAGGGNATWGKEGYYFTESQEASQLDMAKHAGTILKAKGLISTAEPEKLSVETIRSFQGMGGGSTSIPNGIYTWAANTRTRGDRTRKLLGYKPDAPSFWETMESDLMAAKRALEAKS